MIDVAYAQSGMPAEAGPLAVFLQFLPLVLVMVVFYFLVLRPQLRRQREVGKMIAALKKGDRVLTNGGMYGEVIDVKDDRVVLRVADNVKIEFVKSAVVGVIDPTLAKAAPAKSAKEA